MERSITENALVLQASFLVFVGLCLYQSLIGIIFVACETTVARLRRCGGTYGYPSNYNKYDVASNLLWLGSPRGWEGKPLSRTSKPLPICLSSPADDDTPDIVTPVSASQPVPRPPGSSISSDEGYGIAVSCTRIFTPRFEPLARVNMYYVG